METTKDKNEVPATTTTAANNHGFLDAKSLAPLIAGLAGGSISTALLLPLDNVKVRLQVNEESGKTKNNTTTVERHNNIFRFRSMRLIGGIIKYEGVVGLYQGMAPALMGSSLGWGGYFYLYEGFKQKLKSHNQSTELSSLENFEMACSAGAVMVFLTNPFWLIKLRMQLQMKRASAATTTKQPYTGMMDAARTIILEEGPLALYKGTGPALLLTSHGGVQFVVYEFLRKHFHAAAVKPNTTTSHSPDAKPPILQRLELSLAYLMMGATAKMYVYLISEWLREFERENVCPMKFLFRFFFYSLPTLFCFEPLILI
jgi:solute carrier family 25 (mitochondrial folate transporter), member 32